MRFWVPGANGFLGRHVVQEVLRRGHELFRLDIDLCEGGNIDYLVPRLDAIIQCAAVTRWTPKPHQDDRFLRNVHIAQALAGITRMVNRYVLPMPHGALEPWNAYSQSMTAAAQYWRERTGKAMPVYLPTLYGVGDPHHAKAIPSFLMCAIGRGEQAIQLYPKVHLSRQFMHVEKAAALLVDRAEGNDGPELVLGERWNVRAIAFLIAEIAQKYGRTVKIEERGWQWRQDGIGAQVPSYIGPPECAEHGHLEAWLEETISKGRPPAEDPRPLRTLVEAEKALDVSKAFQWFGAAAKDYMVLALRGLANPSENDDERLDQLDRYWNAMSPDERDTVERLLAEGDPHRVASGDATPDAPVPPSDDPELPDPDL